MCCDLHTHTTASDGSDTPSELVQLAKKKGLSALAVTDHDTLDGLPKALKKGYELDLRVIPGVELSVVPPQGNMHVLGYYIDLESQELHKVLKMVQEARAQRNPKILKRLSELGYPLSMDELDEIANGGQIGRPHIARAMVAKGYVKSVSQAFEKFLKKDAPAYVPKSILLPEQAVKAIHQAGGVAVLAHPISLDFKTYARLEELVDTFVNEGFDGIECYYSEHSQELTNFCIDLCKKYDLLITGGSDYHGRAKPHISLGSGRGNLCVPDWCAEELEARVKMMRD